MKKILILVIISFPLLTFAQSRQQIQVMSNPTYSIGYVDGIRIDSINQKHAQIVFETGRLTFHFDSNYGKLRDKDGNLVGASNLASTLNFLDYNGWEYVDVLKTSPDLLIVLLKKKVSPGSK